MKTGAVSSLSPQLVVKGENQSKLRRPEIVHNFDSRYCVSHVNSLEFKPFSRQLHFVSSSISSALCSVVTFIANNMDPDQTASKQSDQGS